MSNNVNATGPRPVLLEAKGIAKAYTEVPVLRDVSFALHSGEILGLVGHNGAGKSTLLKVFSGAHKPTSGKLYLDGSPIEFASPSDAIAKGISTVYQELSLLPDLTVTQNVWLGREKSGPRGLRTQDMRRSSQELMDDFGLEVDVDRKVGEYPVGTRQMLEIAIAASRNTRCLLLDEPTTALEGEQVAELMSYLTELVSSRELGIILVNHKLDELYGVCDRIIALTDGRVVIDASTDTVDRKAVVEAIAGPVEVESEKHVEIRDLQRREPTFFAEDLANEHLEGVSISGTPGRILGIYGLGGSGRSETLRAIAGVDKTSRGEVVVEGVRFRPRNPATSIKNGIAFVTEERKRDGIVPQMDSITNMSLPILDRFTNLGVLSRGRLAKYADEILSTLQLKGDPGAPIASLSGGNQQKVLLARALAQAPKVLLLDEPTKGVDIGVKREIHSLLRTLAHEEGLIVVMVSSEEEEILDVADEVLVFVDGHPSADYLPTPRLSISRLRHLAWGSSENTTETE